MLSIYLLGGLRIVRTDGEELTRLSTRKATFLLTLLTIKLGSPCDRVTLAELFWPKADPSAGRNSLNVAVYNIRKALGLTERELHSDFWTLRLNAEHVFYDGHEFEHQLYLSTGLADDKKRAAHLCDALEYYKGPLFPGPEESWLLSERHRLARLHVEGVRALVGLAANGHADDRCLDTIMHNLHLVDSDPDLHIAAIQTYKRLGQHEFSEKQLLLARKKFPEINFDLL
jgi:DNA-binding SARP family transcriptional activator